MNYYGKIENGVFSCAPSKLHLSARIVQKWTIRKKKYGETETAQNNAPPQELVETGLPIVYAPFPKVKEGFIAVSTWKKQGGMFVVNPSEKTLRAEGYLPIVEEEPPTAEEGQTLAATYRQGEGKIVQSWEVETNE